MLKKRKQNVINLFVTLIRGEMRLASEMDDGLCF